MRLVCFALLLLLTYNCVSASQSESKSHRNPLKEDNWNKAKEFLKEIAGFVFDRMWSPFFGVDIARSLVDSFDTKTLVTDLTVANEAIRGMEFDYYDENHGNRVYKGIKVEDFEKVVRVIAESNNLPEKFVNEILLGKDMDSNEVQKNEFKYNVGEKSDVWYCVVSSVKVGDKIDLAMAYYNLKFKPADRRTHHSKVQTFLGIPLWTNEWTTSEPRKLSTNDQSLFLNFLRAKAVTSFIKDHYHVAYGNSHLNTNNDNDEL